VIILSGKHHLKFNQVSKNIKKFRGMNNMTQRELADKVGISLSYLSKIEASNCNKSFSLHVLFDIADALNVDIKEFFD
jgi:transcriptional regulator with XRE-family HTH domain